MLSSRAISFAISLVVTVTATEASECASAHGSWQCNAPDGNFLCPNVLTLTQNTNGVISGMDDVNESACYPYEQWSVGGTFLGNGQFTANSVHPNGGSDFCVARIRWEGTLKKPGCHTVEGTVSSGWDDPPEFFLGSFTWSKSCEVPNGELSNSDGWSASTPTAHVWVATISPSGLNFGGRTVQESGSSTDTCWFPGSIFEQVTAIDGPNPAIVNTNNQYNDLVGWVPAAVTYYRAQNRAPCSSSSVQTMRIDCATSNPVYINNGLFSTIGVTTVSSSRAGQSATRTWPE